MSESYDGVWWISPVDRHKHSAKIGPRPDVCAVCALDAENKQLRAVVDAKTRFIFQLGGENERLRAVVEAARVWLDNGGLYSADLAKAVWALEAT